MDNISQGTVLIIDDNTDNLQALASILRTKCYKVAMAKDGFRALNFVTKKKPDIILLDIMMPEMDGFQVCRELKKNEDTKDIPVIFISALTEIIDKIKGFESGGVDYITKPFQKEEVFARVNVHLKLKKMQEDLLKTNELLQRANATKDKLFSIIGHDLRGPIGTLHQILEMIVKSPDLLDRKQKLDLMNELRLCAQGAYLLLENLLCWARSQREQIRYEPYTFELNSFVDANINILSGIAENKSIRLYSEIKTPIGVYADKDMIMTVIRNLISNALKFTPKGGDIKVNAIVKENEVEISVADTGVGISEENINKLFHSDTHFSTYGTQREKGSGLGLLLCKEFVEKNGGKIWLESIVGKGSIFKFTTPKAKD